MCDIDLIRYTGLISASFCVRLTRKGWCPLRMNSVQMNASNWFYRGRTPQRTQYEMVENYPQKDFQAIRLLDFKSCLEAFSDATLISKVIESKA